MRSEMMGILADTGQGGRMLLMFLTSHGEQTFETRPPLSSESGSVYRQQDKTGPQWCRHALYSISCKSKQLPQRISGCAAIKIWIKPSSVAGSIWEWRITVDPSFQFEVAPVSTLLDFGWPDLTAPLVCIPVDCPLMILQASCCNDTSCCSDVHPAMISIKNMCRVSLVHVCHTGLMRYGIVCQHDLCA